MLIKDLSFISDLKYLNDPLHDNPPRAHTKNSDRRFIP